MTESFLGINYIPNTGLSRLLLGLTGSCPEWPGLGRLLLVLTGSGCSCRFDRYFAKNGVTVQNLWPFEVLT